MHPYLDKLHCPEATNSVTVVVYVGMLACQHVGGDDDNNDDDDDDDDVCLSDNDGIDGNDAPQLSKDEPTRDPLDTTDFEQLAMNVSFFSHEKELRVSPTKFTGHAGSL